MNFLLFAASAGAPTFDLRDWNRSKLITSKLATNAVGVSGFLFGGSRHPATTGDGVRVGVLEGAMPRWIFLLLSLALALSVAGSLLIVLRSPNSLPPVTNQPRAPQ
jgi:hypothetical protein